jgi:hypothetical protein
VKAALQGCRLWACGLPVPRLHPPIATHAQVHSTRPCGQLRVSDGLASKVHASPGIFPMMEIGNLIPADRRSPSGKAAGGEGYRRIRRQRPGSYSDGRVRELDGRASWPSRLPPRPTPCHGHEGDELRREIQSARRRHGAGGVRDGKETKQKSQNCKVRRD